MNIAKHFHKDNLHHAYIIEGTHAQVLPEVLELLNSFKINTIGNPDFSHIEVDSFKIDDARNLKALSSEKAFSEGKKIFLISANNFLLEAQNTLLKMFEEPIPNTHFFLVIPDVNVLLPTFKSRFYIIKTGEELNLKEAEKFIKSSIKDRIEYLKELLAGPEEDDEETAALNSSRANALKFLNSLESSLHGKLGKAPLEASFEQIFKVRQYLRQSGSSAKSLMESVALIIPNF